MKMMSVSNYEYPDIDPTDNSKMVNHYSKHEGSHRNRKRRAQNIMALAAMYGASVGGFGAFGGWEHDRHNPLDRSRVDNLLDECKQIKGISAKEMGTSGKKKLSRAQRKNKKKNGKNNNKK